MAQRLDSIEYAVWRILRREGICLQRLRSWCVSTDQQFTLKAADVVGFYLNLPLNAVLSNVDEKPSTQVTGRPSGCVETDSCAAVRSLKSTTTRHGTLNLFSALNVGTGEVQAKITDCNKLADFQNFLEGVIADQPRDREIQVILDNYYTHRKNDDWLAGSVRQRCLILLHADISQLAEANRDRLQPAYPQGAGWHQFQNQGKTERRYRGLHSKSQLTRQAVPVA